MKQTKKFLDHLNKEYARLHTAYEKLFWVSYMGDHSVNKKKAKAEKELDTFRSNSEILESVRELIRVASAKDKERLKYWELFFSLYQTPPELAKLKNKITQIEAKILKKRATRKEGYIDPKTKKFVKKSAVQMRQMMRTDKEERTRKACYLAVEKISKDFVKEYVEMVGLRNQYAKALGFSDFYAYKARIEEGMTKKEIFSIFGEVYKKSKHALKDVRKMEKAMPGLRKPWNFSFMMAGDFVKEEDPYMQFNEVLMRWGRSFAALGVDFKDSTLQLDLLDRKGKYSNGFCHWPRLVEYKGKERIAGSSNFTCTAIPSQIGSGSRGLETLFHEGGHAAHYLNSTQKEVCLNHEYPPASTAWAETHSMFMDSVYSSIEWRMRYAKNAKGESYPFSLYKRKVEKLNKLAPLAMFGIIFVAHFEKEIYECKNLSERKVIEIARKMHKRYLDKEIPSLLVLYIPHIYSWGSACSYHAYGLALLSVAQWREYFYKKYGYIVDNKRVGKEMQKVWALGSSKTYKELVMLAIGKPLSPKAYLDNSLKGVRGVLAKAKKRIDRMKKVPLYKKPVQLNATIKMVHGKKTIASNKKSFEHMARTYKKWLDKNYPNNA